MSRRDRPPLRLRTGDTVEGEIRGPKEGERYFALTWVTTINFDDPETVRHRVNLEDWTPLYPDEKLKLDTLDPTIKDKSARVIDIVSPLGKGQRFDRVASAHRKDRADEHRAGDHRQ